ncbi:MAG: efflux RND transporter periplasmic adaptor subunit [Azoarcus sp.]|jgi:HlyD family secretion protein|nr:efflux RND transporter periplasmic adaptor subunit [Azoarcus sp.]
MKTQARFLLAAAFVLLSLIGGGWYFHRTPADANLTVYGNVDFRQAAVPFNGNERIAEILVEEGDIVKKGQLLARMDTRRLAPELARAEAAAEAQKAAVERLRNGSRTEEIAQARANLAAARADAENAKTQYQRRETLGPVAAVSQQDIETAKAADDMAQARVNVARNALRLTEIGPRAEDIAQAEAQLKGLEAQSALIRQQLSDAELRAPYDAVIRSRLMEPGEMAAPSKPVFSLAALDVKWVRAYLPEPDLGRVRPGASASIRLDSLPGRELAGRIGFISPVAEFTPKTVQTEDLRTSLVYEIRIFVQDPENILRLGMPATVRIPPDAAPETSAPRPPQ